MVPSTSGPLASIVTPCLNPGDRLERCLASVRSQTYTNVEHIVVDGGSTDGTVERLACHPGVRWVSEPDGGQTEAINKGFKMAKGEYLGWLNADDELLPDAVELAVDALRRKPSAGWVYGNCIIRESGEDRIRWALASTRLEDLDSTTPPQPGSMLARWALEEIGALDEGLHLVMDIDLWYRLVRSGVPSVHLDRPLAIFEIHAAAKTKARSQQEWATEFGLVRLKHGRIAPAAIAFGRGAAHAAAVEGRVERRRLGAEVRSALDAHAEQGMRLPRKVVWAAARTEAAVIEESRPLLRLRHLLSPWPWTCGPTRRLIIRVGMNRSRGAPRLR